MKIFVTNLEIPALAANYGSERHRAAKAPASRARNKTAKLFAT
jgi:hypothetical protein